MIELEALFDERCVTYLVRHTVCSAFRFRSASTPIRPTVPEGRTSPVHSSLLGISSSEFLHFSSRPSSFELEHTCQDFVPHRGITKAQPLIRRLPASATFRPQVFSTSRRFLPHFGSQACCILLPRPGFSLFRGFSLRTADRPRQKTFAPVPLAGRRSLAETSCHDRLPRLRGFHPPEDAFQRCGG